MGTVDKTGMRGEPAAAEAGVTLQQPEVHCVFSKGSCPWMMEPGQWWAAQAPGGVWIVTCACTQDSWWLQQQRYHFMPISGVRADSRGSLPFLELV